MKVFIYLYSSYAMLEVLDNMSAVTATRRVTVPCSSKQMAVLLLSTHLCSSTSQYMISIFLIIRPISYIFTYI